MSASTMHAAGEPGNEITTAAHEAKLPDQNDLTSQRHDKCQGIRGIGKRAYPLTRALASIW